MKQPSLVESHSHVVVVFAQLPGSQHAHAAATMLL